MGFGRLIDTTDSHFSLLPEIREMAPFGSMEEVLHKSLQKAGFLVTAWSDVLTRAHFSSLD